MKVTDKATLKAGDKIAITNFDGTKAMSIEQTTIDSKTYYRGSAAFDVANVTSDVELIELVASGDNFKLKVTGGFLYYDATWTKNWLGTNETGTDFNFEVTGDTLRVVEVASGRYIMYNTSEARFAAYATTSGLRSVGTAIYVVTGEPEEVVEPEEAVIESKTIAEFIAAKGVKCYLTGEVGEIKNNTYGNFNLTDKSGTIYVYGCLTAERVIKEFSTLGVKQGDTLTVLSEEYQVYKEQDQLVNAIYVSHIECTSGGDDGDDDDYGKAFYVYNSDGTAVGYGIAKVDNISFTKLTPDTTNGHKWVDLGLPSGTKWATCNVGATSPEGYGKYYAWGETTTKQVYSWTRYKYGLASNALTKYCNNSSYNYDGFTDDLTTLEAADDAATANWGKGWRTPTSAEWQELIDNCEWVWKNIYQATDIAGYWVTGKNGNTIFLPAASQRIEGSGGDFGGYYWSCSLDTDYPNNAWGAYFNSDGVYRDREYRCYGLPVRPVCQ